MANCLKASQTWRRSISRKCRKTPFTGLELEYQRREKGYVIYSVGADREDNGGLERADKKQSGDKQSYDITFTVER